MTALAPNTIARPYRGVSVQPVPTVEPGPLREHLLARPVYRRTDYVVAEADGERALVKITRGAGEGILVPALAAEVVAHGEEIVFIDDESVDVGIATAMAAAAAASGTTAPVYVVQGRFQHVNFIAAPAPIAVRVVEVVPPLPPKLLEMADAIVAIDGDLPPLALILDAIDLRELIDGHPDHHYLLPCRSGGLDPALPIDFLDAGPQAAAWTMVGCERSRQIHAAFYGEEPAVQVDFCPRRQRPDDGTVTLSRCCLLERGIERDGAQLRVPWGASLDEVRTALRLLVGLPPEPQPAVVIG